MTLENNASNTKDVGCNTSVTRSKKTFTIGTDATYTHAVFNHRDPEVIKCTLERTENDYHKLSKIDQARFMDELREVSHTCIPCLAVSNRRKVLRRTWSAKRTPKIVNEFEKQDLHNTLADEYKTNLRETNSIVIQSNVQVNMGTDGEWKFSTLGDSLSINAIQEANKKNDERMSEEDIVEFVTPTLMGKVNDEMNHMIRRYDLNKLKLYEVMFADLKSNPDGSYTLVWVDYKSSSVECVVINSKTSTTTTLMNIMVSRGVNKLLWSTMLIYDGDGANNALSGAMSRIGIATMFGLPYRQSLNFAERIIGNMSHIAKRAVYRAKLTPKWFGWAMEHAAHHHNYMYSKSRGASANEMVYGKKFDVRHLVPYAQLGLAHKSDTKMNDTKRNLASPSEASAKAEPVIVTGYPTNLSKTLRLQTMRGAGATIHSRDVVLVRDNRDPREINSKMSKDNLDNTKVWAEDSSEAQSIPLRGVEPAQGSSNTVWMSDDETQQVRTRLQTQQVRTHQGWWYNYQGGYDLGTV
jgi:hypothetical protein